MNNYPDGAMDAIAVFFNGTAVEWAYQEEIGKQNGTPHIQGYVHFKEKCRPKDMIYPGLIHWEVARNIDASREYCQKSDTKKPGGLSYVNLKPTRKKAGRPRKREEEEVIDIIPDDALFDWQKEMLEIITQAPEKRRIYWLWEPDGGAGKTEFQRYLIVKHGAIVVGGKANDIKCAIAEYKKKNKRFPRLVLVNITRSVDEKFISYQAMEDVKDALFFSGKYESGMVVGNPPHLIVFANIMPREGALSADRLKIIRLPPAALRGEAPL